MVLIGDMQLSAEGHTSTPQDPVLDKPEEAGQPFSAAQRGETKSAEALLKLLRDEDEKLRRIQILSVPTEDNLRKIADEFGTEPGKVRLDNASAKRMSGKEAYFIKKGQGTELKVEAEAELVRRHMPKGRSISTTTVKDKDGQEYHAIVGVDGKTASGIVAMIREEHRATKHKAELLKQLAAKGNHEPDTSTAIDPSKLADAVKALGGDAARQTPEGVTAPTPGLPKPPPSRER